ncbi:MAG: hypothetical protein U0271_15590 [Polyangiaceae bacterium]
MNWQAMLEQQGHLSLEDRQFTMLTEDIAKLEDNAYAIPRAPRTSSQKREGTLVTGVVAWASSDGAARRALSREIEADDPSVTLNTPRELDVFGRTHAEIVAKAEHAGKAVNEYATYRIAGDGAFVSKCVTVQNVTFHFRSNRRKPSERPFAIVVQFRSAAGAPAKSSSPPNSSR